MRIVILGYRQEIHDAFMKVLSETHNIGAFRLDSVHKRYLNGEEVSDEELDNIFSQANQFFIEKSLFRALYKGECGEEELEFMQECEIAYGDRLEPISASEKYLLEEQFPRVGEYLRANFLTLESKDEKFKVLLCKRR